MALADMSITELVSKTRWTTVNLTVTNSTSCRGLRDENEDAWQLDHELEKSICDVKVTIRRGKKCCTVSWRKIFRRPWKNSKMPVGPRSTKSNGLRWEENPPEKKIQNNSSVSFDHFSIEAKISPWRKRRKCHTYKKIFLFTNMWNLTKCPIIIEISFGNKNRRIDLW